MERIEVDQQVTNLIEKIKQIFVDERMAIEMKRQEVQKLMKDRVMLDDREEKLRLKEVDLAKREKDLAREKDLNREKGEMLARREKKLEEEKNRLQNIMNNI